MREACQEVLSYDSYSSSCRIVAMGYLLRELGRARTLAKAVHHKIDDDARRAARSDGERFGEGYGSGIERASQSEGKPYAPEGNNQQTAPTYIQSGMDEAIR